jgi:glycoside/pentoside/hexuronide:cation symporter, GPH family
MDRTARLSRSTLAFYAFPAFALAMPTIPVYVYLPTYYADTVGLGLTATGLLLLAARLLDVVTDPLVGVLSDRWRSRWGRRRPWILLGALFAALGLVQLFQPPQAAGPSYLLVWAMVLYLGWTLVAVPYTAWGAEMSDDYHERARITGGREAAMILGILAAGALPAVVTAAGGSEPDGLAAVAWLAILIGTPAIALLLWRVPERDVKAARAPTPAAPLRPGRLRRAIGALIGNRPFLRLLSAWFINGLANGFPAVLFPLYLQYGLQAGPVARGGLIMAYFVAGVAAIPFWLWLSRRIGKHKAWCAAMAIACAAFIWVPLLGPGDIALFAIICIVTGTALGADLALPPAMQADVVDFDTLRTNKQRAGLFFAMWSMATKLALACAVGIAFPLLDLVGFEAGGANTAGALLALALIYAVFPTLLKGAAIALIWRHPIDARRQNIIRRRLTSRATRGLLVSV